MSGPEEIGVIDKSDGSNRKSEVGGKKEKRKYVKGSIYSPENVSYLRNRFSHSPVAIIDANGVLCNAYAGREDIRLNSWAEEAMQSLKDNGYRLILWTSAAKPLVDGMKKKGLNMDFFDLVITRENYEVNPYRTEEFDGVVNSTDWLSDREKMMLRRMNQVKTPQLFFGQSGFVWVEDQVGVGVGMFDSGICIGGQRQWRISGGEVEEVQLTGGEIKNEKYVLVDVSSFGDHGRGDYEPDYYMGEAVFGMDTVRRILGEEFTKSEEVHG